MMKGRTVTLTFRQTSGPKTEARIASAVSLRQRVQAKTAAGEPHASIVAVRVVFMKKTPGFDEEANRCVAVKFPTTQHPIAEHCGAINSPHNVRRSGWSPQFNCRENLVPPSWMI